MSGVSKFEVIFNRQDGSYLEGDTVTGVVLVELKHDIVIENMDIVFRGMAVVQWSKAVEKNSRPSRRTISKGDDRYEEEQYLNQKLNLYTRENNKNREILVGSGTHNYPFSIQLPETLPSTFIGDYGFIRYFATVVLEFPFQQPISTNKEFRVQSVVDINSAGKEPVVHRNLKAHHIICFAVGDVNATWRLNRKGFLPGEYIEINADIENNSRLKILKTKASLIQHIQYQDANGLGNEIYQRKRVARIQKGEINAGEFGFWREKMKVPVLPPSGLKGCRIIKMWYTLKLLVIPSLFKPIENVTDIVIGTSHHRPQLNIRYDTDNAPTAPQTNSELNFFV